MQYVFSLLILTSTAVFGEISFLQVTEGVDELNATKTPTDPFITILSDISENSVHDAVQDFTNYRSAKMVLIRNTAQSVINLNCRSVDDTTKSVNIHPGHAYLFTFRPRKDGKSLFWCNLKYQSQFARFDVYNEDLPYMCPRAIHEVYQYTVRDDGVYVDHRSEKSKIRDFSKGFTEVILWKEFKNNQPSGFLYSFFLDGGICTDLPIQFNDKTAAVTLCKNHCVHIYEHYHCSGKVQTVQAGNNCTAFAIAPSLVGKVSAFKGC